MSTRSQNIGLFLLGALILVIAIVCHADIERALPASTTSSSGTGGGTNLYETLGIGGSKQPGDAGGRALSNAIASGGNIVVTNGTYSGLTAGTANIASNVLPNLYIISGSGAVTTYGTNIVAFKNAITNGDTAVINGGNWVLTNVVFNLCGKKDVTLKGVNGAYINGVTTNSSGGTEGVLFWSDRSTNVCLDGLVARWQVAAVYPSDINSHMVTCGGTTNFVIKNCHFQFEDYRGINDWFKLLAATVDAVPGGGFRIVDSKLGLVSPGLERTKHGAYFATHGVANQYVTNHVINTTFYGTRCDSFDIYSTTNHTVYINCRMLSHFQYLGAVAWDKGGLTLPGVSVLDGFTADENSSYFLPGTANIITNNPVDDINNWRSFNQVFYKSADFEADPASSNHFDFTLRAAGFSTSNNIVAGNNITAGGTLTVASDFTYQSNMIQSIKGMLVTQVFASVNQNALHPAQADVYLKLDRTYADSVGTGGVLTVSGSPTFNTNGIGGGTTLKLPGSAFAYTHKLDNWCKGKTSMSLSLWARFVSNTSSLILAGWSYGQEVAIVTYGGSVAWNVRIGGASVVVPKIGAINDGKWHHVVGTYNSTQALLYVDGIICSNFAATAAIDSPGAAFAIGGGVQSGAGSTSWATPWVGEVDEVSIWNRALTASEVAQLYSFQPQSFQPVNTSPLVEFTAASSVVSAGTFQATSFIGGHATNTVSFTAISNDWPIGTLITNPFAQRAEILVDVKMCTIVGTNIDTGGGITAIVGNASCILSNLANGIKRIITSERGVDLDVTNTLSMRVGAGQVLQLLENSDIGAGTTGIVARAVGE